MGLGTLPGRRYPAAARAVVEASSTIPVVIWEVLDPLSTGPVASFAHPGGQVTGMSNFAGELVAKQIELFKAAVPTITKIAVSRCPECERLSGLSAASYGAAYESYRENARSLGITLVPLDKTRPLILPQPFQRSRASKPMECSCWQIR